MYNCASASATAGNMQGRDNFSGWGWGQEGRNWERERVRHEKTTTVYLVEGISSLHTNHASDAQPAPAPASFLLT